MKLSGVMIGTEDSKKLGNFYDKIFGPAGWKDDGWYGYDIGGSNLVIGPHSEVHGSNVDAPRIMISLESDDVKKDFEMIKDKGGKVVAEPYEPQPKDNPGTWLATLADPDGNYLQLSTPWSDDK